MNFSLNKSALSPTSLQTFLTREKVPLAWSFRVEGVSVPGMHMMTVGLRHGRTVRSSVKET
eukprot:2750627-Rhodomonas_salina.1